MGGREEVILSAHSQSAQFLCAPDESTLTAVAVVREAAGFVVLFLLRLCDI